MRKHSRNRRAQLGPDGRRAGAQALTYFCIYVVRQGVTSWFVFYLMKVGPPGTRGAQRPSGTAGATASAASAVSTSGCCMKTWLLGTCCGHAAPAAVALRLRTECFRARRPRA